VKTLGVGQGNILSPHIDIFLADHNEFAPTIKVGGIKVDDGHFHPSGHCLMSEDELFDDRYLQGEGAPGLTAATKKTFDCGHMWHGYIQAALVEMGFVKTENVEHKFVRDLPVYDLPLPLSTRISGTVDLLDVKIPGRGKWLVDIKTASVATFNRIEQTDLFEKYRAQVNVYGDQMGSNQMLILVIQKDSPHLFREIQIQRDESLLEGIYQRWINVAKELDHLGQQAT
jgi:hypothetical protein